MYSVEVDGHTIHDPRDEHFILPYAKLDLELNKTGSFEFDITTENPGYEYVSPMKSVISVYDDGKLIFRGRSTTEEKDFYNTGTLKCEGELSYFVDTILRPRSSAFIRQTNRYIFSEVVKEHNNQVGADKQFQPGIIDVDQEEISSISFNYEKPLDFINKNLIEKYKGYLRIRYADGKRYLDWVKQYGDLSGQEIRFGYNLLDLKKTLVSTDVCTVVVPVGGSDKKVTVKNAVVGGKSYGKDYIQNDEAVNYFGEIIKMQEFPDKKSPNELYAEGEKWLLENMKSSLTVELTALDLHMVDVNIDDFKLGDLVKVVSVPHSIVFKDDLPVIEKYSYDITDPSKNTITVGKTLKVFTERKDPVIYDKVQEVTGRFEGYVETTDGKIEEITNEIQEFKTLVIQDFTAVNGSIEQLTSKQADFETATAENFISTNAEISNLSGDFVSFKTGEFDSLKAKQADFQTATAEHFTALQAQIDSLDVGNLDAKYATIENLNAANATITTLTGDLADYKKITTENLSSTTGKIDTLTGDLADYKKLMADELLAAKGWMAEGSIGSAQISDLTANKIRGGTLDTSLVTVAGSDGKLQISDNTMQIKDSSRVRVQVGKDEGGDYTLAVWDKNGKLIWDALGATENTIQRKIIRDNVVADNANIQGSKLDINSVIRSVNGATEKISSTVVSVGDKSLKILLEEQSNTITEQEKTLTSQGTQIKANQDSIKLKVDTQTYTIDKTAMIQKLDKATSDISVMQGQITLKVEQTDIDTALDSYSTTAQMNSAIELSKTGILSTVENTYSTKTEVNTVKTTAEQTASKFQWIVKSGTSATDFILTDRVASLLAEEYNVDALTTFKNSIENGTSTVINGGAIKTGTIKADRIDINDIFSKDITATGTITGVELAGATGSFSGNVTATTGTIGGFTINTNQIYNSTGGSGNYVGMSKYNGGYAFYAGATDQNNSALAKFRVGHNGVLRCSNGSESQYVEINSGQLTIHQGETHMWIKPNEFRLGNSNSELYWNGAQTLEFSGYMNLSGSLTVNTNIWMKGGNIYPKDGDTTKYINSSGNARLGYLTMDGNVNMQSYDIQFTLGHGFKYGGSEWMLRGYKSGDYNVTALGNGNRRTVLYGSQVRLNGANGTTVSSDGRLKKDFADFDERYEKFFMNLKPQTYRMAYKRKAEEYKRTNGFIAQDVEHALINSNIDPDELDMISCDTADQEYLNEMFNGHPPDIQKQYSLNYNNFIALNTHMIQKNRKDLIYQSGRIDMQQVIIDDLQSRLWQAEKQIKELKQTAQ